MGMAGTAMRPHAPAAALIALAGVLAAACGTVGQAQHPVRSRTPGAAQRAVPPGGSPAEARAVGRRMLASLNLPAGSRRIAPRSQPPRGEVIGGENVVDVSRFFWLPLTEEAAASFLQHHVPPGDEVSGTGSVDSFLLVQYSRQAPPAGLEKFNMLVLTLAVGPNNGTLMRADAELTWYPSRSPAEFLPPHGYRSVTVRATFYSTLGHQEQSITRVFTSQTVIARLALLLDGMHAAAPRTGSCPAILPQFRIVFAPKGRGNSRTGPVSVRAAGCDGELVTVNGKPQPVLEDPSSMRLFAAIAPLLGVHRHYW